MTQLTLLNTQLNAWKPHDYQIKGIKFLLQRAGSALFFEPGAGKTSTVLGALKVLFEQQKVKKVLIVAPIRVCYDTWPNEMTKWADFSGFTYTILHGKDKDKNLKLDRDIYLINFEGLDWLLKPDTVLTITGKKKYTVDLQRWNSLGFDMLVVDELSKFKNTSSKRYKAMKCITSTFKRRWGLTGSPSSNGLMNLFGECFILDNGLTFGPYITHFRFKYFYQGDSKFDWKLKPGAQHEIFDKIKSLAMVVDAESAVDLPEMVINDIKVTLPEPAQRVYDALEKDLIAYLSDDTAIDASAAAISALSKCQQVANGNVYITPDVQALMKLKPKDKEVAAIHTAKFEALENLISELDGAPLLVGYTFQHDYDGFCEFYGEKLPRIGGGTTNKEAAALIDAWNNGDLPVLFGHPASIGHGLNLQKAGNHVCWLSLTWDFELYDQFIRRVYRQGINAKRVFVHRIISRNTVDEQIKYALSAKDKGQRTLFEVLKNKNNA